MDPDIEYEFIASEITEELVAEISTRFRVNTFISKVLRVFITGPGKSVIFGYVQKHQMMRK